MAYAHAELHAIQYIPSSAGALYTQGASPATGFLRTIIVFNGNTTAELVKLYKVPNSTGSVGTAGASNQFYQESIEAGGTRIIDVSAQGIMFTATNDTLQGTTTTASKVTIQLYGGTQ